MQRPPEAFILKRLFYVSSRDERRELERLDFAVDHDRFRNQGHAETFTHAVTHSAGDSEDVLSGCAAAVRNRQGVLGRQARTALSNLARLTLQAEALLETGVLNQPSSRKLHVIGVLDARGERGSLHDHREVRGALGRESRVERGTIGLVKKEPVEKVSRSSGLSTMPLEPRS